MNTTGGPVRVHKGTREDSPHGVLNTSKIFEEDLKYVGEEPEVLTAVSATGWYAAFKDGSYAPLVLWSVWDDGSVTGVVVGENGTVDAKESVESRTGFVRYANNSEGE